jgi:BolA family transcriptional regulator, general stress-responsive regulator
MSQKILKKIEELLGSRLNPVHLDIFDDSARHAGHAGAAAGGGHYAVRIVSETFEGKKLLEQHRLVKEVLKDLMGKEIHALQLKTLSPSQWRQESGKEKTT